MRTFACRRMFELIYAASGCDVTYPFEIPMRDAQRVQVLQSLRDLKQLLPKNRVR